VTDSANLDLVRSIYAAPEGADWGAWAHPQIEFVIAADGPSPSRGTGLAAAGKARRDLRDAFEDYRYVVDEYRELDDERVLVIFHRSGRGRTSGLPLGQMGQGAHLLHVRHGKVTRLVGYFNRERAFADLGLAPEQDVNEAGS
jgi:ketosteroid isomerase-like protein